MTSKQVYERINLFFPSGLTEEEVDKECREFDADLKAQYERQIPERWTETDTGLLVPFPYDDIYLKLCVMRSAQRPFLQCCDELHQFLQGKENYSYTETEEVQATVCDIESLDKQIEDERRTLNDLTRRRYQIIARLRHTGKYVPAKGE